MNKKGDAAVVIMSIYVAVVVCVFVVVCFSIANDEKFNEKMYQEFEKDISDNEKIDYCDENYDRKSCYDKLQEYKYFLHTKGVEGYETLSDKDIYNNGKGLVYESEEVLE